MTDLALVEGDRVVAGVVHEVRPRGLVLLKLLRAHVETLGH